MATKRGVIARSEIRTLFGIGRVGDLTDGQLLERFVSRDGEATELAFSALIDRHGPMVLDACRWILRDEHQARDAFQAVFLLLVRKAGSLWVRDSLGPWLHQVAVRTASSLRSAEFRRRRLDREAARRIDRSRQDDDCEDLSAVLHEEIGRLPDRNRAVVVLCDLEGLTREQAALRLGWPPGTVQSRLARGRRRLRDRLARRGIAPTVLAGPIAETARVSVPADLACATIELASHLATGRAISAIASASVALLVEEGLKAMTRSTLRMLVAASLSIMAVVAVALGGISEPPPVGPSPLDEEPKPAPAIRHVDRVSLGTLPRRGGRRGNRHGPLRGRPGSGGRDRDRAPRIRDRPLSAVPAEGRVHCRLGVLRDRLAGGHEVGRRAIRWPARPARGSAGGNPRLVLRLPGGARPDEGTVHLPELRPRAPEGGRLPTLVRTAGGRRPRRQLRRRPPRCPGGLRS